MKTKRANIEKLLIIYFNDLEGKKVDYLTKRENKITLKVEEEEKVYRFENEEETNEMYYIIEKMIKSEKTIAVLDFVSDYKSKYLRNELEEKGEISLAQMVEKIEEKMIFEKNEGEIVKKLYSGVPKEIWSLNSSDLEGYKNLHHYCLEKGVDYWEIINVFEYVTKNILEAYENVAEFITVHDSKVYISANGYLILKNGEN